MIRSPLLYPLSYGRTDLRWVIITNKKDEIFRLTLLFQSRQSLSHILDFKEAGIGVFPHFEEYANQRLMNIMRVELFDDIQFDQVTTLP